MTNLKRATLLAILLMATLPMQAQRIRAFLSAGAATSQVEGDELKGFDHWGLHGGVGAWIGLDERDRWAFSVEADYSCRGISSSHYTSQSFYNINMDLHYVDIPVTFFFHDPYGGLRLGAGLVYSRLVSQPNGYVEFLPKYFVPDTSDMKFLKNDLAAALEARIDVWKGLQLGVRYQHSLIPVKKDWHFWMEGNEWANNCFNSSLTVRLTWMFGYDDRPSGHRRFKSRRR